VLARYQGSGKKTITLTGTVGKDKKTFTYETEFLTKATGKPFVEELWARRKVGYLLDQIRLNGEKKELVEAVTALAKKYGITTPYTSYLIVPDAPVPVALGAPAGAVRAPAARPPALDAEVPGKKPLTVAEFARFAGGKGRDLSATRNAYQDAMIRSLEKAGDKLDERRKLLLSALDQKKALDRAYFFKGGQWRENQLEKLGVDLAYTTNNLKSQTQLSPTAQHNVAGRTCLEIGGVWIDRDFTAKTPTLAVKAQSDAYFRILERQPQVRDVFRLGNHLVWVAPSGTALIIDASNGKEKLSDKEIDALFVAKK
jgi:Ca-activated chloride channel family protein